MRLPRKRGGKGDNGNEAKETEKPFHTIFPISTPLTEFPALLCFRLTRLTGAGICSIWIFGFLAEKFVLC
jgi:hypothetical protein